MRKKDPFKNVIGEYVMIFIVLGFILWLALGSITEFAIPLDSLKKISGTVSHVEYKTSICRLSRGEISECTRTIIRLKDNHSSYALTSFDNKPSHQNVLLINKIDSLVLAIKIRLIGSNNSPPKKSSIFMELIYFIP